MGHEEVGRERGAAGHGLGRGAGGKELAPSAARPSSGPKWYHSGVLSWSPVGL